MVFFLFGFSNHFVHIHYNFFMHHVMEQSYHSPLISGPCVFQFECITLEQKVPRWVMKVVFSLSLLDILILLYLEKSSMNEYVDVRDALLIRISMCGKWKSTFELALFKFMSFTYILILCSFLGTYYVTYLLYVPNHLQKTNTSYAFLSRLSPWAPYLDEFFVIFAPHVYFYHLMALYVLQYWYLN